ncbi:MAG: hypothetical protein E4G97_03195 [Deltaproteobacteria bacterium]|nr:MAG: hypothetical protein E4G97_03195 [Deltaproteobacteria bacterium]
MNGKGLCVAMLLVPLTLWVDAARAADRSTRVPVPIPQGTQARQRTPLSAAEMNRIPVRVQPRNTQAKLQAALAAVEKSEQGLKAAATAMVAYLDRESACVGKSWTAQDMETGCRPEDTLKLCREKLVTACASGRGPGKGKLWSNVKDAAKDLGSKSQAVNSVYSETGPQLVGGGIDLGGLSVF